MGRICYSAPMLTRVDTIRPQLQRFARQLPNLHAAIYGGLHLLMADGLSRADCLVSRVSGSPDLYLTVLERHDYTSYLQLTYVFPDTGIQNPNAYIRVYHMPIWLRPRLLVQNRASIGSQARSCRCMAKWCAVGDSIARW